MMPEAEPRDPRRSGGRTKKTGGRGERYGLREKCMSGGHGVFRGKSPFFCRALPGAARLRH